MKILLYILLSLISLFLLYVVFLFICSLFYKKDKVYDTYNAFYRSLADQIVFFILFFSNIRVELTGEEKIPDGQFLFIANHRSNYDPFIAMYALKKYRLSFVSKPENFKIPIIKGVMSRNGFLPIDRDNPKNAIITINKAADILKKGELNMGIYPEGTRNKTGQGLLEFKPGAYKIAQKAQVPIVVCVSDNTDKIYKRAPFRKTVVHLDILDVISVDEVMGSKTVDLAEKTRNMILENLKD